MKNGSREELEKDRGRENRETNTNPSVIVTFVKKNRKNFTKTNELK